MDFRTLSNIYSKPWLIEGQSALRCLDLLNDVKQGKKSWAWNDDEHDDEETEGRLQKLFANSDVVVAPLDTWEAKSHPGYNGKTVAILPLIGPVMKEDFCGIFGTASLKNELTKINATESIKTVIVLIDSPGGTVDGTESLANAITNSPKETIAAIDGYMCSAAYWIGSACDKVIATSSTDIIGCIGTMIAFYDNTEALKKIGYVLREYYASDSTDKNKDFREAKKGNGKLLIQSTLDPINNIFLDAVKENRGNKLNQEETLTGKTFVSAQALEYGLIDEISSMDQIIQASLKKQKNSIEMKISNLFKSIRSLFGKKDGEDLDLSQEQLQKIDEELAQVETLKADNARLKDEATANQTKITDLEGQVQTLNTDKANQDTKITELNTEIKRLGALDGGKFTSTSGQEEKKGEDAVEYSDSQKEMLDKANNM